MAISIKRAHIVTDDQGDAVVNVRVAGIVRAIALELGSLSTPDIEIVDALSGGAILDVSGADADTRWQPVVLQNATDGTEIEAGEGVLAEYGPPAVFGNATITVAGAGDTKSGAIHFAIER